MSLRFVIGRSGSGKTTRLLNEIKEQLITEPEGSPVLYIVPEQMTFLSEQRLVHTDGLAGMIRTQVYSFTRLAWRIIQETGGASRNYIASTGTNMLIRKIIEDHKHNLQLFKKAADKKGFIQHIEALLTEFKHYCVTPEELRDKQKELAFGVTSRALADKLHDLEIIFTQYEKILQSKYIGTDDYLNLLARSIEKSSYLEGAEIYIDGFQNFTPQEYRVIEQLLNKCKRVTIALMVDRPFKFGMMPDDLHLFRITGETYSTLYEIASNNDVDIEEDIFLHEHPRFRDKGLQYLEKQFDHRSHHSFSGRPGIELKAAANRRAEIEGVAREIRHLVTEKGYRYKEIAVLMRNGKEYQDIIRTVFNDYEVPYFIDQKRSMLNHPLIELIRSSLEAVQSFWRYEPVFRAVKTDLLYPFSQTDQELKKLREQMDQLENYVLANGIKGKQWEDKQPWPYKRFIGLELNHVPQTDAEKEMEATINHARTLIFSPLKKLATLLKKANTGREFCEALYIYLEELEIPRKLELKSKIAEERGQLIVAREHDQAWGTVIHLLDQFVEIFGDEAVSLSTFMNVIDSGLEAATFSLIPPAMDQVFVADMELSRLSNIKISFIIGLNDGVLPATHHEEGIFSDEDRNQLMTKGLQVAPSGKQKLLDEDFIAYRAFTTPMEKLYVSYPLANDEGKALLPSPFIKRIKDLFPDIVEKSDVNDPSELPLDEQFSYISHPNTTIAYLSSQLQLKKRHYPIAEFWWDVYNYYMDSPVYKGKVRRVLSSLFYQNEAKKLSEKTSAQLYGDSLLTSVSRMELFYGCPFSHFSSYGLKLREREVYRLEAPHIGDLFHGALKWIAEELKRHGLAWNDLSKQQCEQLSHDAVEALAPKLLNKILLSSNRYFYILRKLEQIIARASYALSSHAKSSSFVPIGLEVAFGPHKELPPLTFTLKNGTTMQLQGRIDRVDKAEDEHGVYLRVIDYKSSSRGLDLNEVYHGLALQMLTYLDIIVTHSYRLIGTDAFPAGVLYFHVHNPMVDGEKLTSLDQLEDELLKQFKMKGLLLGDANVVKLMDQTLESGSSSIVSASLNKDGSLSSRSKASMASKDEFKVLQTYIRNKYRESGNRIISGDVNISPYRFGDRTPCQFCAFRPVCQFDQSLPANDFRVIPKQPFDEIIKNMQEVEENES